MIPKIECSDFGGGARRPIMELEQGTPSFNSIFVLKMIITFVNLWYYFAKVQVVKDAFIGSWMPYGIALTRNYIFWSDWKRFVFIRM